MRGALGSRLLARFDAIVATLGIIKPAIRLHRQPHFGDGAAWARRPCQKFAIAALLRDLLPWQGRSLGLHEPPSKPSDKLAAAAANRSAPITALIDKQAKSQAHSK